MYFPFVTKRGLEPDGGGGSAGRTVLVNTSAGIQSASSRAFGGGTPAEIPAGQPFAGRMTGGATRADVYGTRSYGSGYPGLAGRGVANRGFPFIFWPLAWGGVASTGAAAYLHTLEYGTSDNSSRPGGPMFVAAFSPNNDTVQTFRIVAENSTVVSLIEDIYLNCSSILSSNSSAKPVAYESSDLPQPEQTIQYYRASSVALTFDGYNNTGALAEEGTPDTALPPYINVEVMNCLNATIGDNVLLMDLSFDPSVLAVSSDDSEDSSEKMKAEWAAMWVFAVFFVAIVVLFKKK
ncbi:hypothetical protein ONZ45_g7093 [Pleurotus djamor]|nr:hypothetical protein ONZ45_g7093 [Pleurotus djamor]